ncbi:branched-chain-amino-acid aminotransferase, cytosolic-like [Ptychodera flava]|uniref:branched-chain-amino-acid aminotransferase, cytosolic-like n=1 Tax=Ptychodera flava TaxID=63121 RepID=UPI003969E5A0
MAAVRLSNHLLSPTRQILQNGSIRLACLNLLRNSSSFKAEDIEIELAKELRAKPDPDKLVFGKEFSDHMLTIAWNKETGWAKPQIKPFQNFSLHPAASALHYSVELFEGMKAYRGEDNKIRMFRPEMNMKRMLRSTQRASLPEFDGDEFIKCMKKLISIDKEWVPYSTTSTLYIRPTHIGTTGSLGVNTAADSLLFVILSPVGPYFPTGFNPVKLLADPQYIRAFKGGVGDSKLGGNYGPTIMIQQEAVKQGCQQVLWLYGDDHQLTEVGTMNIFMFWKNAQGERELVTPPLDGLILPGITRKSLLDLARDWNEFKVTERTFTMAEVMKALKDKRVLEIFGAGTACVVCPVDSILYGGQTLEIPTMAEGAPLTKRFMKELTDIQFGRTPSNWVHIVE